MSSLTRLDDGNFVGAAPDSSVHYFEIAGRNANNDTATVKDTFHNWGEKAIDLADWKVIPNGINNDIPKQIQETTLPNSLAPRIQNRKVELLLDQGPYLYQTEKGENTPVDDTVIMEWLESMGYREQLTCNAVDYYYSSAVYTKVFRELGARVSANSGSFALLENVSSFDARKAYRKSNSKKIPTHVIVGDWYSSNSSDKKDFSVYPIFDPLDPLKYPVSVHIASFKTYGMKHYSLPEIYGALPWIKRNTTIPEILKSLTDNSLNIKWHITSPTSYWDAQRKILQEKAKNNKEVYDEKMLTDLRQETLRKLTDLLSGVENVGKFWHNEETMKIVGASAHKEGWDIKPIEQKVKDYVKAQLEIALASSKFVIASLGLHSALANVGADGKSDPGSEQIYAYKIHQSTSTPLAEYYVTKAFNDVIKLKFGKSIKVGFKRAKIDAEAETTPGRRLKNQEA